MRRLTENSNGHYGIRGCDESTAIDIGREQLQVLGPHYKDTHVAVILGSYCMAEESSVYFIELLDQPPNSNAEICLLLLISSILALP